MNEDIEFIIDSAKESMEGAINHLEKQLVNIRAGKANPSMLSSVKVEYYGSLTPLNQVSNVNTPDARTLSIQPFEKSLIKEIEKAIMNANLGFNPMNNGENVIINVPPLTEERRIQLGKQAKSEAEEAKIGVRNDRRTAMNDVKSADLPEDVQKDTEDEIQKLTDQFIAKIDKIYEAKEKEIMTV
ncbi:MAG: ribosome recycling factor [Psychroflexus sp.]